MHSMCSLFSLTSFKSHVQTLMRLCGEPWPHLTRGSAERSCREEPKDSAPTSGGPVGARRADHRTAASFPVLHVTTLCPARPTPPAWSCEGGRVQDASRFATR
jgi:hypothetical protein